MTQIAELAEQVERLIERPLSEADLTEHVAQALRTALAQGVRLDDSVIQPHPTRYVTYPLHIDSRGRFSIASAVWNVGQQTPIHSHETWGVVGVWSGLENEVRFSKPATPGTPPQPRAEHQWGQNQVTVCCTTDDDVHQVSCGGDVPCVGIHIYGADLGTLRRRAYDPTTGEVTWFVSEWSEPSTAGVDTPATEPTKSRSR